MSGDGQNRSRLVDEDTVLQVCAETRPPLPAAARQRPLLPAPRAVYPSMRAKRLSLAHRRPVKPSLPAGGRRLRVRGRNAA